MAVWGQQKVVDRKGNGKRMERQKGTEYREMEREQKREKKWKMSLRFSSFLGEGNKRAILTRMKRNHNDHL